MTIENFFTESRVNTKRGNFRLITATIEEAKALKFYEWFTEGDFIAVADGERAFVIDTKN